MTDTAINIAAALDGLCRAAGVSPDETSESAGYAVGAALVAVGVRLAPEDAVAPEECAIARYLIAACGRPCRVLVTERRVILTCATKRFGVARELVPLPNAVQVAVQLVAGRKVPGLFANRRAA